jgi:hypothetical protein
MVLWVRCPACRTINATDLRALDRHPNAAVTSLIVPILPAQCAHCRIVGLSRTSVADEMREEHHGIFCRLPTVRPI